MFGGVDLLCTGEIGLDAYVGYKTELKYYPFSQCMNFRIIL